MTDETGPGSSFLSGRVPWKASAVSQEFHPDQCFDGRVPPPKTPAMPQSAEDGGVSSSSRLLLLGCFSFLSRPGARERRDGLRKLWRTDEHGVVGGVTTRFLMLQEDLDRIKSRSAGRGSARRNADDERLLDLWGFPEVRPAWAPVGTRVTSADANWQGWMSKLGSLLLLNAFVRRGLSERPTYQWIGRTDADAAFNLSATAWRLDRVRRALDFAGAMPPPTDRAHRHTTESVEPRMRHAAIYGPIFEWLMWDVRAMRLTCWHGSGPNRWLAAVDAFQQAHGNASALGEALRECIVPGARGPFPFAGGPLAAYSRPLLVAMTSLPAFSDDEKRLRREMDLSAARTPHQAGRYAMLAEDVYYGHLAHAASRLQPLALVTSQFFELRGGESSFFGGGDARERCHLADELGRGALSARIYHGLKGAAGEIGWRELERHAWLLHHEQPERLSCRPFARLQQARQRAGQTKDAVSDFAERTGCCSNWRHCSFRVVGDHKRPPEAD